MFKLNLTPSDKDWLAEVWEYSPKLKVIELDHSVVKPVRCFLIRSGSRFILVDTGYRETVDALLHAIDNYSIEKITLTHLHLDHSGGADYVKAAKNVKLYYHEYELRALQYAMQAEPWLRKNMRAREERMLDDALRFFKGLPSPDSFVEDGESVGTWRVMHMPGHTPGHVIFADEDTALTGDLILMDDTSNVAYVPIAGYHPLSSYLTSLVKLVNMRVKTIIPSHGPFISDARQRVSEIFSHHLQRLKQVARGLQKGLNTPSEIAEQVRWSKGSFSSINLFDRWLAILETLSHLDFLTETGYAVSESFMSYHLSGNPDWQRVEAKIKDLSAGVIKI